MKYRVAYGSARAMPRSTRHDLPKAMGWLTALLVIASLVTLCTSSTSYAMCKDPPCVPDKEPGGNGPFLKPVVSMPDLALQIVPCLTQFPSATQAIVGQLTNGITQALLQLDVKHDDPAPAPDVQTQCSGNTQTFAVWAEPPTGYGAWDTSSARLAAFPLIQLLQPSESFAFSVSHDGIERLLDVAWRDIPKHMNDAGQADPNGKVHLDFFSSAYSNATNGDPSVKQVVTSIDGWYDGPLSDDDFTILITDTLHLQNGLVLCDTNVDVDVAITLDTVLNAIFNIVGSPTSFLPPVVSQGPACRFAALLPPQVLIPGVPLKIVFTYTRLDVNAGGITAAGSLSQPVKRSPAVSITGPNLLKVELGDPVEGVYRAITTDLRPPLKVVQWSSPDATVVFGSTPATIQWNIPVPAVNQQVTRLLSVSVTDADNVPASTSKLVTIKKVANSDQPDVCSKPGKQDLPQCKP